MTHRLNVSSVNFLCSVLLGQVKDEELLGTIWLVKSIRKQQHFSTPNEDENKCFGVVMLPTEIVNSMPEQNNGGQEMKSPFLLNPTYSLRRLWDDFQYFTKHSSVPQAYSYSVLKCMQSFMIPYSSAYSKSSNNINNLSTHPEREWYTLKLMPLSRADWEISSLWKYLLPDTLSTIKCEEKLKNNSNNVKLNLHKVTEDIREASKVVRSDYEKLVKLNHIKNSMAERSEIALFNTCVWKQTMNLCISILNSFPDESLEE